MSELKITIQSAPAKAGAEDIENALDRLDKRADKVIAKFRKFGITPVRQLEKLGKTSQWTGKSFKQASSSVDKLATLMKKLAKETKDANKQMKGMGKSATSTHAKMVKFVRTVASIAATMMIIARIKTIFVDLVKSFLDFQKAMKAVQAVTGVTRSEFLSLSKAAIDMSLKTVWSATEAAEAMKFLAMAGLGTKEIIIALPSVLDIAAIGQMELGKATDIVTDTMTAFGLGVDDVGEVVDAFTCTITRSNTDIQMMGESMKHVAPTAHALGYTVQKTASMIGILSKAGIKAGIAGRGLQMAMLKSVEATHAYGLEQHDVMSVLKAVEERYGGVGNRVAMVDELYGIFGARALKVVLTLQKNRDELKKFEEGITKTGESTRRTAKVMQEDLWGAVARCGNAFRQISLKAFIAENDDLTRTVGQLTEFLKDNADELIGFMQGLIMVFTGVATAAVVFGKAIWTVWKYTIRMIDAWTKWKEIREGMKAPRMDSSGILGADEATMAIVLSGKKVKELTDATAAAKEVSLTKKTAKEKADIVAQETREGIARGEERVAAFAKVCATSTDIAIVEYKKRKQFFAKHADEMKGIIRNLGPDSVSFVEKLFTDKYEATGKALEKEKKKREKALIKEAKDIAKLFATCESEHYKYIKKKAKLDADYTDKLKELSETDIQTKIRHLDEKAALDIASGANSVLVAEHVVAKKAEILKESLTAEATLTKAFTDRIKLAFADTFHNVIRGEMGSFKEFFAEFLNDMTRAWSEYLAKKVMDYILAEKTMAAASMAIKGGGAWIGKLLGIGMGAIGGGGMSMGTTGMTWQQGATAFGAGGYHDGGIVGTEANFAKRVSGAVWAGVPRFHNDGLVDGEVPIIAKRGEGVFTEGQMRAMGNNKPQQVIYSINAVDARSFAELVRRNPEAIHMAVQEGIEDNKSLLGTIRANV